MFEQFNLHSVKNTVVKFYANLDTLLYCMSILSIQQFLKSTSAFQVFVCWVHVLGMVSCKFTWLIECIVHLTFEKMNSQENSNMEKKEEMFNIKEKKKQFF